MVPDQENLVRYENNVRFDRGSAVIRAEASPLLDYFATVLKAKEVITLLTPR